MKRIRSLLFVLVVITLCSMVLMRGKADDSNSILESASMPATTITGAKALAHFGGQGISNTFSSSARPIAVGDFNRDGIKDIAISSPDSTTDELRVNA